MPGEVREHLTRDQRPFLHPESLQTLYIPSSMTVLLLFSSLTHSFYRVQVREHWHEIRDHSFIQNNFRPFIFPAPWRCFFSSVHLTHVLQGSGQRTGMAKAEAWFCAQWPILCCFLGLCLDYCTVGRFLTESVTYWFFYLLVFDIIHDAMCLNKMSRTSSRNIGPQHKKHSSIFHCTHGALFIPVFTKPILSVCC